VRERVRQLVAAVSLLLLPASWTLGLAVALHVADGHRDAPHSDAEPRGLALAFHGHSHGEGTPAHEHPVLQTAPASLTVRMAGMPAAVAGSLTALVDSHAPARRFVALADPAHDPPRRPPAPLHLRI